MFLLVQFVPAAIAIGKAVSKAFGGADPLQVPAAQLEQVFESAAKNLFNVAQAGLITPNDAIVGMQSFQDLGLKYLGQMNTLAARNAAINIVKVITQGGRYTPEFSILLAQSLPTPTADLPAVNLVEARKYYIPTAQAGWYPQSLQQGATLTDEYLKLLPSTRTVAGVTLRTSVSSVLDTIKRLTGVSGGTLALIAIPVLIVGYLLLRK